MSIERAVHDTVAAIEQAWNTHDAGAFASVFQPDASFTNVFGIEVIGREKIQAVHERIFSTMFRDSRLRAEVSSVRAVRPDVACASVRWRMTGAYDLQGKPWPERDGLMSLVLVCDRGAWAIAVFHNMDLPPQAQVAAIQKELLAARA